MLGPGECGRRFRLWFCPERLARNDLNHVFDRRDSERELRLVSGVSAAGSRSSPTKARCPGVATHGNFKATTSCQLQAHANDHFEAKATSFAARSSQTGTAVPDL
jgi:hypothetical protein